MVARLISLSLRVLLQWLDGDQRTPVILAVLKRGLLLFHADSPSCVVSSDTDSHVRMCDGARLIDAALCPSCCSWHRVKLVDGATSESSNGPLLATCSRFG